MLICAWGMWLTKSLQVKRCINACKFLTIKFNNLHFAKIKTNNLIILSIRVFCLKKLSYLGCSVKY